MAQQRAQYHFNLHSLRRHRPDRLWSVSDRRPGHKRLVIDHVGSGVLCGATFHVSEASRQRVLGTKQRSVHAWVVGQWTPGETASTEGLRRVSYNPYRCGCFHLADGSPVWSAARVVFGLDGKAYI